MCIDSGGGCEAAVAYEKVQVEAAKVVTAEAKIADENKAAKKELVAINSYLIGIPKNSVTYENVTSLAKSYLSQVATKLSGSYGHLATVSYSTYNLYKAYQNSPFQGNLGANARVAVNWYKSSAVQDQAEETAFEGTAEQIAESSGFVFAEQDFLTSLFP
jgi:hypothetical protein